MAQAGESSSQRFSSSGSERIAARITRARGGSDSALGELFEACRKYMLLVANRGLDSDLRPKGGASDLVQETFVEAKRDFKRFEGRTEEELFAWLTSILANRVKKQIRAFRKTKKRDIGRERNMDAGNAALFLSGDDETPSALVAAQEERHCVRVAMDRLSSSESQVLVLRTWKQLPFEEIGVIMNRSPDAARKLWARAVERLGREMESPP
jgi:RNA polymerase sigma-70 factor, ECF subfamily